MQVADSLHNLKEVSHFPKSIDVEIGPVVRVCTNNDLRAMLAHLNDTKDHNIEGDHEEPPDDNGGGLGEEAQDIVIFRWWFFLGGGSIFFFM